ncbi:hypothetical protein D3C80_1159000 [compost metagenome]
MDHQPIAIHVGVADVRFRWALLHLLGFVGALQHHVRLGKALIHVANASMYRGGNITVGFGTNREVDRHMLGATLRTALVLLGQVVRCAVDVDYRLVVYQRCPFRHRLIDRHHRFKHLVFNVDQC